MKLRRFDWQVIALMVVGILFFAAAAHAKLAGNTTQTDAGRVTAIDLQEASVVVDAQPYSIDKEGSIMDTLRSKGIQVSDEVVITYEIQGVTKRLLSITKKADAIK